MTNQTIMDMYLACYSQEEIAAAVDMPRKTVADKIDNFGDLGNLAKSAKTHASQEEIAAAVEMPRPTVIDKINKFVDLGNLAKTDKTLSNHEEQEFQGILTWRKLSDMYLACYSQEEIAAVVDVPQNTISTKITDFINLGNLAKTDKTLSNHEEQEFQGILTWRKLSDMYLACYSQEEIAAAVDLTRQAITQKIDDYANFGNLAKNCKTLANHEEQEFQEEQLRNVTQLACQYPHCPIG